MKKYLARISIVMWVFAAFFTLMVFASIIVKWDSNAFSYLFLLMPAVAIVAAISFILTGTIDVRKILKMCQDENKAP